jgi:hypothetical protein
MNKYLYLHIVQGLYGHHGWEDLTASENFREARDNLRDYNENEPQYPHRLIKRREPNPEYKEV